MLKRIFDIVVASFGLLVLSPLLLFLSVLVALSSPGGIFYRQERVGRYGKLFVLLKFRSMRINSDRLGLLTIGGRDPRVTRIGYFIRKYKLDELPQLINVLKGDMSIVGPRPEVKKYVDLYTEEQKRILLVRPGISDYASIEYINENELLAASSEPEKTYITEVMPAKLRLNEKYIAEAGLLTDLKIIIRTIQKLVLP